MLRIAPKLAVCLAVLFATNETRADPPMTPGAAAAQGKALGQATNPSTAAGLTNPNRLTIMPATPAPRDCMPATATSEAYFNGGNGNLSTNSTAMLTSAAGGVSPECQAINFMQGKSSSANPITINPADPLVVGTRTNINNPAGSLGGTMGIFVARPTSQCLPGAVTSGGNATQEACQEYASLQGGTCEKPWNLAIQPWWTYKCEKTPYVASNSTCTKEEQPTVVFNQSCVPGSEIAIKTVNRKRVKAICDVSGTSLTFRVHAWGRAGLSCTSEEEVTTAKNITTQTELATVEADWFGNCEPSIVAVNAGSTCSNGVCNFEFTFGEKLYACAPGEVTNVIATYLGPGGEWINTDPNLCYTTAPLLPPPDSSCPNGYVPTNGGGLCINPAGVLPSIESIVGDLVPISFPEPVSVPIVTENTVSDCGQLEGSGVCTPIGSTCLAGVNETRVINGHPITKACWKTEYTFSCRAGAGPDHCAPLTYEPRCAQLGVSGCSVYAPDGTCSTFNADYKCTTPMGPPPNVTQTGTGYEITQDSLDASPCNAFTSNPNCTKTGSVCIDDADKVFFGFTFSRTCWKYKDTFSCAAGGNSNCQPLIDQGCALIPTATTCTSYLPDGQCGTTQKIYQCGTPATTTPTGSTCDTTPYCINGICYDTTRPGDADFGQTVAGMEVAREIGTYIDPATHEIFKGVAGTCRRKLFGLNNCCKTPSSGNNWTNAAFYAATSYGRSYMGSTYTFDGLFNGDGVNWMGLAMQAGGILISGATTASIYGVTIGWAGGQLAIVGFDPTSMAIAIAVQLVLTELTSCDTSDQNVAMKKAQGICQYVGTYCSSKFLGICKTKKEGYCCYNSKLAKAINVGGKVQLGRSLGSPQSPDCRGLTITEVQNLDFSRIDLSEFIASIVPDELTDTQSKAKVVARLTNYTPALPSYGNVSPPNQGNPGGPNTTPPPPPPTLSEPTITATWNPSPGVSGQSVVLSTVTTHATGLTYDCTGAWVTSGSLIVGNTSTTIPIPGGLLGRAICLFTATNAQFETVRQFDVVVGPPNPVITAGFIPNPVRVGDPYHFVVNSNNADEVTYSCTGRSASGSVPVGAYTSTNSTALFNELGTVTCTFSAKSYATGMITSATATQSVVRVIPRVEVIPASTNVVSGSNVSISVSMIDATSASYSCTGLITTSGVLAGPAATLIIPTAAGSAGTMVCQFSVTSASNDSATRSTSIIIKP